MRAPPFRNAAHNPTDRAHKRKLLWDNSPAERYRSMMRRWLDWVDIRLSPMKRKRPGAKGLELWPAQYHHGSRPCLSYFGHYGLMDLEQCD